MLLVYKILIKQIYGNSISSNINDFINYDDVKKIKDDYYSYFYIEKLRFNLDYATCPIINLNINVQFWYFFILDITNNKFLTVDCKNKLVKMICDGLNVYHKLSRFVYLYKYKRARQSTFDTDLLLNPLSELSKNTKLELFDEKIKTVYTFRISDILSVINTSLTHAPFFYVQPQEIKNPFTNIPFTNAMLYNLYFKIKQSSYVMPPLFALYFSANFDMGKFIHENKSMICDISIKNYVLTQSEDSKLKMIKDMIYDYTSYRKPLIIHEDFPNNKLIEAFECMMENYHLTSYSLNEHIRIASDEIIKAFFLNFRKCNPNFGRKVIVKDIKNLNKVCKDLYTILEDTENKKLYYFIDNVFKTIHEREIFLLRYAYAKNDCNKKTNKKSSSNKRNIDNTKYSNKRSKSKHNSDQTSQPLDNETVPSVMENIQLINDII